MTWTLTFADFATAPVTPRGLTTEIQTHLIAAPFGWKSEARRNWHDRVTQ